MNVSNNSSSSAFPVSRTEAANTQQHELYKLAYQTQYAPLTIENTQNLQKIAEVQASALPTTISPPPAFPATLSKEKGSAIYRQAMAIYMEVKELTSGSKDAAQRQSALDSICSKVKEIETQMIQEPPAPTAIPAPALSPTLVAALTTTTTTTTTADLNPDPTPNPAAALPFIKQSQDFMIHKMWPEAIGAIERALEFDSQNALYYNKLGCAYFGNEEYNQAGRAFMAAIKLDQKCVEPYKNLARAWIKSGNYLGATLACKKALTIELPKRRSKKSTDECLKILQMANQALREKEGK